MTNHLDPVDILLIEDDPNDKELMLRALKKNNLANHIYTLEDGVEALDYLYCRGKYESRNIHQPPQLIILDLKLPKISGLEVLKRLKSDERTMHIPVVVVTSSGEQPDVKEAYQLGANSFVVKPVDFNQFMHAMSNIGMYWLLINQPHK